MVKQALNTRGKLSGLVGKMRRVCGGVPFGSGLERDQRQVRNVTPTLRGAQDWTCPADGWVVASTLQPKLCSGLLQEIN
ncbi:hypothetical protein VFPPC_15181 [Pochonia chlamydosporia 170]|uniref:Uncharacterized protein n=1 Tax=Pochonia chlamydosporia 170 TaxID=1380566 RepID=A0A179G5S4_METCM|nr:hypothetical protein VFPPC_15181 [Pochonia chlamydosporia 170]OAQ72703.1 hypothetical protein VFPPC_15181 [Pochonia chlamydosporia 170]